MKLIDSHHSQISHDVVKQILPTSSLVDQRNPSYNLILVEPASLKNSDIPRHSLILKIGREGKILFTHPGQIIMPEHGFA